MRKWLPISLIMGLLLALAIGGLAGAHTVPQRQAPAPNSISTRAPAAVALWFSEPVSPEKARIEVLNVRGEDVTAGAPQADPADPTHLTAPLRSGLPIGTYTVKWQTLGADGHTAAGRYQFHVVPPAANDHIRIFVNGREVRSDVPPQIVQGRTMVPLRAVSEALGQVVEYDAANRAVLISPKPAGHHSHEKYQHPEGTPAPTVKLTATPDPKGGFNLRIETTDFTWAPEQVNTDPVPNAGHGHLYVDGVKVARLYGPWYYLDGLAPGPHDIEVTLNANNHAEYADDHGVIKAQVSVVMPAPNSP